MEAALAVVVVVVVDMVVLIDGMDNDSGIVKRPSGV